MESEFALAALPLAALGCSMYAVWSLYRGWQESRCQSKAKPRRQEHPVAAAVQTCVFVGVSIALLLTGFSILVRTARQSPYAQWLQSAEKDSGDCDSLVRGRFDDLPGSFEIIQSDPSHPVVGVSLTHLSAGDSDVARLADRFPELEWIHLQNTRVTDSGLDDLCRLHGLRMVVLSQTSISDRGLERLGQLHDLEELRLCQTQISDEGLGYLERLPSLRRLDLSDTQVTRRGVRKLRAHLPDCVVRNRHRKGV